ncbi:hypothetical protein HOY80DRAFT_887883 [Tuber brumale]|nr:hypothetical protein HOY80DRAFT_887883 [Tuber brumale]
MSDAVKPEDTKPVAVESPKSTETEGIAAVSETVTAPVTTSDEVTPVAADKPVEETSAEEKKEDDKPEPKEITQGTLSRFPSGLMAFFKTKRFFYFQDEPIPEDRLKVYLQKANSTHATAAHASQTGKGLLLYSKAEGQSPHGIIKLADVAEVAPLGAAKFVLKIPHSNDLHFESPGERDSWIFTLNHKINEAKAIEEEIVSSEGYKATLKRLSNPTPIAAAKAPEGPVETKEEKETGEAKPEEDAEKRSASKGKKRGSVFGFLRRDRVEEKKGESTEKDEPKEESNVVEPTAATTDAPAEVTVGAEVKETEAIKPAEGTKEAEKTHEAPVASKPVKRHSYFPVNPFNREKKEKEVAEDKKEGEAPEHKTETEAAPAEVKPIDVIAPEASTASGESRASPPRHKFYAGIFDRRGDKTEKEPETKPAESSTEPATVPATTTESTATPAEESTVAEATSPATSPREQKRKSSFFSPFKKEKRADDVKSDTEEGEPSSPKPSTSPVPKPGLLTGLIRKASKAGKGKETEPKEVTAPATVAEETTPAAPVATTEAETSNGAPATTETNAIGDVVPEAVTVGQAHPVQAAA